MGILQSAVGGFIFAGPLGIIKGLGGWAANKITNKFISANSSKGNKRSDLDNPNLQPDNNNIKSKKYLLIQIIVKMRIVILTQTVHSLLNHI